MFTILAFCIILAALAAIPASGGDKPQAHPAGMRLLERVTGYDGKVTATYVDSEGNTHQEVVEAGSQSLQIESSPKVESDKFGNFGVGQQLERAQAVADLGEGKVAKAEKTAAENLDASRKQSTPGTPEYDEQVAKAREDERRRLEGQSLAPLPDDLDGMTKAELEDLAKERSVDVKPSMTKAEIIGELRG
jgi:hypothetical protein